jgi:cation transport protein ChaC
MLQREELTRERIDEWVAEARQHGYDWFISHEERAASLERALAGWQPGTDSWVFGYGSLMWNPAIKWAERRVARLEGYRRSFCFWTPLGRGTPQLPGLMLALEPGEGCEGIAWRVAAEDVPTEFGILWNREMLSGVYRAEWVDVTDRSGEKLRAITFVVEPQHRQYVADLSLSERARHIAFAEGRRGCCRDYLAETVMQLREIGTCDAYIDALVEEVRRLRDDTHWPDPHPAGSGDPQGPGGEES